MKKFFIPLAAVLFFTSCTLSASFLNPEIQGHTFKSIESDTTVIDEQSDPVNVIKETTFKFKTDQTVDFSVVYNNEYLELTDTVNVHENWPYQLLGKTLYIRTPGNTQKYKCQFENNILTLVPADLETGTSYTLNRK